MRVLSFSFGAFAGALLGAGCFFMMLLASIGVMLTSGDDLWARFIDNAFGAIGVVITSVGTYVATKWVQENANRREEIKAIYPVTEDVRKKIAALGVPAISNLSQGYGQLQSVFKSMIEFSYALARSRHFMHVDYCSSADTLMNSAINPLTTLLNSQYPNPAAMQNNLNRFRQQELPHIDAVLHALSARHPR